MDLEFEDDDDESPEWAVPEHKVETGAPEDEIPPPPASTTTTAADSPEVEHTMASLARALRQNSVLRESLTPMTPPGKKL